jgi:hypothetical protein
MLRLAIATGELEPPREVALAILADVERRARRFDEALAACAEAEQALEDADEDDSNAATVAVIAFMRELAEAGDDECHSAAEAFARDDLT